jgi:UDP-N-acetylmuramoyl-tripeptide--D-alanyl-D-alanine ligase
MWPKTLSELAQCISAPLEQLATPHKIVQSLSTDSRKVGSDQLFVAIRGETHDGHNFVEAALKGGAVAALVEKGWLQSRPQLAPQCLAVSDTTQAMRALGKAFRTDFTFPVIAVGGSNGKTTTKEMLACLLGALDAPVTRTHKSENGFLGLAITLTQKAHARNIGTAALVAEIGIDDVGAMQEHVAIATPDIALLTALGPEHLAGLGSWDTAVKEELVLFRKAPSSCRRVWQCAEPRLLEVISEIRENDVVVCEEPALQAIPTKARSLLDNRKTSLLTYSILRQGATSSSVHAHWTPCTEAQQHSPWQADFEVALPGIHNAQNFALALATAALLCPDVNKLTNAWKEFVPPEMRSRIIKLNGNVTLYDDCYNASPASMSAAFDALLAREWKNQHKILVLGDMLDLGEESKSWHLKLVEKLLKFENSHLCLFGSAMYDVYNEIKTKHSSAMRASNIEMRHAAADTDPASFMGELSDSLRGSVILVKGSRGMDLGRFVKSCEAWSSTQG